MNPLCIRDKTMREALEDPECFGKILPGDTWKAWRVILIASQGEPLTGDEREIFTQLTKRPHEPDAPVDELWGIVGRRGGKTRAFSVLAAYLAAFIDYTAVQAPGERLKLALLAQTTKTATKAHSYIEGIFRGVPELAALIDGDPTADMIRLNVGIDIEVFAANFRTVRGETLIGALCDEAALWRDDKSQNPDAEILDALRPGLATTEGPLCVFTSPYARRGAVWESYKRDFGPEGDPSILVVQAPSLTMHPTLSRSVVEKAYQRDPASAAAEFGAEFRRDIENFVSIEAVEACVVRGVREVAPVTGQRYGAFVDVSGGRSDSHTLAIAHLDGEVVHLDAVREIKGTSPDAVTQEFAELCKSYGIHAVTGDNFGAEWIVERFQAHGIRYERSEKNRSQIYIEWLPILNSERCRLLDHPKLISQFAALERRTTKGTGRDIIDHPQVKGAHDDISNAVAGAIVFVNNIARPLRITPELRAMAKQPRGSRRFEGGGSFPDRIRGY
jgi:hypothetical protein